MSEGSNDVVLSTENIENGIMKENDPKTALHSDESPVTENVEAPVEQVHIEENRQSIEPSELEIQSRLVLGCLESNVEVADSSPSATVQLSAYDASTETKSLERTIVVDEPAENSTTSGGSSETKSSEISDVDQPGAVKSNTSCEILPSQAPSSDKGLEEITENIQLIYEGLKDMKISALEVPVSASSKKGRKPPTTPRAKSTPVKPLTSPPLTRSRSRDLRKFPSTPASPRSSTSRKTSESDSDEIKVVRGRQRAKKN